MDTTKPETTRSRVLWFVGIYAASLAVTAVVVYALRLMIRL